MRLLLLAAALAGVLLWSGCYVVSLNPLFSEEKELVSDPALIGSWTQKNDDGDIIIITFRSSATRKYAIEYSQKSSKGKKDNVSFKYLGSLGNIGEQRFLDVEPREKRNEEEDAHHFAVHTIWRVGLEKDSLRIDMIKDEWLRHYLSEHPDLISSTDLKSDLLLTGDAAQVRKMMEQIAGTPEAFDKYLNLKRAGK